MRVHRLHSPFRHWIAGLSWELVAFAAFLLATAAVTAAVVWVL